jgi:type 1 glutamine amidotransferase
MRSHHRTRLGFALFVIVSAGCSKENAPAGGTGGSDVETGGSGGNPSTGGALGTGGATSTGGAKGTGGSPADAGASADTAASPDSAAAADVAAAMEAGGPARVLLYTKTNGTTHVSGIAASVTSFKAGLGPLGIMVDTANDPAVFTEANLAKYAGVIMVSTSGTPFGTPGTAEVAALTAFVKKGGGLAGFHAASSTDYGATSPFTTLLGAETKDQGGGFRMSDCVPEAGNPTVAKLPNPYRVANEEFYTFNGLNPANQVVLRCNASTGTEKIPISWVRQEGAGRVFFSGLGHQPPFWAQNEPFFMNHALPGVLWTIGR